MGRRKINNPKLPRGISMQDGRYRVRVTVDGIQYAIGLWDSLEHARTALHVANGQKAAGTFIPPAQRRARAKAEREAAQREMVTLNQWSEDWLQLLQNKGRSESTIVSYRSLFKHILPVLGHKRLTEITTKDVQGLVAVVSEIPSKRNPDATSNGIAPNVVRTLRSCLNDAVKDEIGGLTTSPVKVEMGVRKVRAREEKGEVATWDEVQAMANAMPDKLAVAVYLAAGCALRLGEVLGLQRDDFENLTDPNTAVIHIRRQVNTKAKGSPLTPPKADSYRTLSIPQDDLPAIRKHLEDFVGKEPDAPLFPSLRTANRRISQTSFDNAWRKARESAGRPTFRFHALRATGLTDYARAGATQAEIMHRGGHSTYDTAAKYQYATSARDREVTARMNASRAEE